MNSGITIFVSDYLSLNIQNRQPVTAQEKKLYECICGCNLTLTTARYVDIQKQTILALIRQQWYELFQIVVPAFRHILKCGRPIGYIWIPLGTYRTKGLCQPGARPPQRWLWGTVSEWTYGCCCVRYATEHLYRLQMARVQFKDDAANSSRASVHDTGTITGTGERWTQQCQQKDSDKPTYTVAQVHCPREWLLLLLLLLVSCALVARACHPRQRKTMARKRDATMSRSSSTNR